MGRELEGEQFSVTLSNSLLIHFDVSKTCIKRCAEKMRKKFYKEVKDERIVRGGSKDRDRKDGL